jgi:hypothetical protein
MTGKSKSDRIKKRPQPRLTSEWMVNAVGFILARGTMVESVNDLVIDYHLRVTGPSETGSPSRSVSITLSDWPAVSVCERETLDGAERISVTPFATMVDRPKAEAVLDQQNNGEDDRFLWLQ